MPESINFMDLFERIILFSGKTTLYVPRAYSFIKFDWNSYIEFVRIVYELQRKRYHFFLAEFNYQHQIYMNKRPNRFFLFQKITWSYSSSIIIHCDSRIKENAFFFKQKTFLKSKFNNFSCTMSYWLGFLLRQMLSGDRSISFLF